jgi:hypothetical protein
MQKKKRKDKRDFLFLSSIDQGLECNFFMGENGGK